MWFNNAQFFHYELDSTEELNQALEEARLKPCPPHARFIYGWMPVMEGLYAEQVAGFALICMGKEERLLPKGVIKQILAEKVLAYETQHGRMMKRADKAQLAEELEFELLPKAFCIQKRLYAILDSNSQRLIINSGSKSQASQFLALLKKSLPGIRIEPIAFENNLSLQFSEWIQNPAALPKSFQLASDCQLFAPDDEKKRFNCKGYELPADEVLGLLAQKLEVAELSLIWQERIQFSISQDLTLKKIKCMDYLVDAFNELRQLDELQQQDAALTLLGGELRTLANELQAALKAAAVMEEVPA